MKYFQVNDSKQTLPIHANLYVSETSNNESLIVFVGGDGDARDLYTEIIEDIQTKLELYDFLSFSFRGVEENLKTNYDNFINDFKELMQHIKSNYQYKEVILVCTSSGSIVTVEEILNPTIPVVKAIFLDPADYYITEQGRQLEADTWSGNMLYSPSELTLSQTLETLTGKCIIHVVGFTIRNSLGNHYAQPELRHIDNPEQITRLNQDMVKAFYLNAPEVNRGKYLTNNKIPHAFKRDGIVNQNLSEIAEIIKNLLS